MNSFRASKYVFQSVFVTCFPKYNIHSANKLFVVCRCYAHRKRGIYRVPKKRHLATRYLPCAIVRHTKNTTDRRSAAWPLGVPWIFVVCFTKLKIHMANVILSCVWLWTQGKQAFCCVPLLLRVPMLADTTRSLFTVCPK